MTRPQKIWVLLAVDVLLVPVALWLTVLTAGATFNLAVTSQPVSYLALGGVMALAGGVFSSLLRLPRIKLNAYEQSGIHRTAVYATLVGIIGMIGTQILFSGQAAPSTMVIFTMILLILSVGVRLLLRSMLIKIYRRGQSRQRVLIYGAGQTGVQLATALRTDDAVVPVAFVDDNKTLQHLTVAGFPVYPPFRIKDLIEGEKIDRVVLAMPSISRPRQARLARQIEDLNCEVSMVPSFAALVGEGDLIDRIQPVNPTDYLGRAGLEADLQGLCEIYSGRTVMITGAGGSIGSELTRQILSCHPARIVLFESSEFALYQLDHELADLGVQHQRIEVIPVLGSVTDAQAVRRTIASHEVEIILHAAAYKHVPLVETNKLAGLNNNVLGTRVVAEAARAAGVNHFILISTDKAVHPTSVMGASKRLAELLVQDLASRCTKTHFGIVRFGNVLGSSGSVVPRFQEQIARGGPVTLTHREVTRYFMTLSEAARLVLMAGNFIGRTESRGDVFLLDMGPPVPIQRLARQMIEAAGYTVCDAANPDGDIEVVITGLRPGEKLHEDLAMTDHVQWPTDHPKIKRIAEGRLSELEAATALRDLSRAIEEDDDAAALNVIARWVGPVPRQTAAHKVAHRQAAE
ncbi:nucleoside-diphosphate sugar epimerase/dehydratase [Thalassorhabdomicrobium marinisediminis]|uniref:polysaccharide biosynthesis protein n=1 Tax=Thalassorhabdomicrobium marinisediminis TaxID=2170577 RepID=UPI0030CF112D